MTTMAVRFIDVCVLRGAGASLEVLLLQRARGATRAGSWEGVHGTIEAGETPDQAARRELHEETGLTPTAWYNLSRVEMFYRAAEDEVALIPVFAALVREGSEPELSGEHDSWVWQAPQMAVRCCTWPRFARTIDDAVRLLGGGDAGVVEQTLRL